MDETEINSPQPSRDTPLTPNFTRKNDKIELQVGERNFVTSKASLNQSGFFSALLARWEHNASSDGSYFIDADGNLFEHVLHYLRRGVFPLFYSKEKGHDYAMYSAILQEAKYFQIVRLAQWIEEKNYLEAVKLEVTTSVYGHTCNPGFKELFHETMEPGAEV